MDLLKYRHTTGVSFAFIARKCSVSPTSINKIANGEFKPTFELALKIEEATNGQVPRDNWYPPRPSSISVTVGVSV